jgi:hypothetical protein
MAFPTSPTNGQLATVNGIQYTYSSTTSSWTRVASTLIGTVYNQANTATTIAQAALPVAGGSMTGVLRTNSSIVLSNSISSNTATIIFNGLANTIDFYFN